MSKNGNEVAVAKYPKVILRKPVGVKETFGWAGEVLMSETERRFVPETFKDSWTIEEINMSKLGHIVKAIADATRYAAVNNYKVSNIILKFGVDAMDKWDAFTKATEARRTAKKNAEGELKGDAKKAAWDAVKDPYNRAVKRATLAMELLAEDIFDNAPAKKCIG